MYVANIGTRRKEEVRREAQLVEWSTKIIASVTAAAAGEGGKNLQKAVSKISLNIDGTDEGGPDYSDADTSYESAPGAIPDGLPDFAVRGSTTANNKVGSAERLLRGLS